MRGRPRTITPQACDVHLDPNPRWPLLTPIAAVPTNSERLWIASLLAPADVAAERIDVADAEPGRPMEARPGPSLVGTVFWASRAALGAGGRNGTDSVIPKRDEEPHRARP